MENLNISSKTTNGGATAAGKLTAEEVNAIVAKINEIVGTKVEAADITAALNNTTIILDEEQFEGAGTANNKIRLKESFLEDIGSGTGGGTFTGQYFDLSEGTDIYRYRSQNGQLVGVLLVTPAAPTNLVIDDNANTLDFTYVSGITDIVRYEFSLNGGLTWEKATVKPLQIGDISKDAGEIGIRVTAGPLNAAGQIAFNQTPFVSSLPVPAAPTVGLVDDNNNTFNWVSNPQFNALSDMEQTLNGGLTVTNLSAKPIVIGNINKAIGQVGVRVKAVPGVRNASAWLFNQSAFTNALYNPSAPTNPITDDTNNTFNWTYTTGYTNISQYEKTLDGGATWSDVDAKPFSVGNVSKGIGQVGVRVKAVANENNASATLFNTEAFNPTEADNTVPVTSFMSQDNVEVYNTNNLRLVTGQDYGWMKANATITEGTSGSVQMDVVIGYPSGWLILDPGNGNTNFNGLFVLQLSYNYVTGASSIMARANGVSQYVENVSNITKVRLRSDGTNIYCEYYTTSWNIANQAPFTGTLRVKGYFERLNSIEGNRGVEINNLRQYNLS